MRAMRVEVPDRLKHDFHALASIFGDLFPSGQVILGGGMLLESSWDHRESTDIDLFILDSDMAYALRSGHQVLDELFDRLEKAELHIKEDETRIGRLSCFIKGESEAGVEWTFVSTPTEGPGPDGPTSVEGTAIRAATFTEIFMGKIAGRAFNADKGPTIDGKQPVPIRDCFDIAVLAAQDPALLEDILARIPAAPLAEIVSNYRNAPEDLAEIDDKPIKHARWTIPLHGLPQRIADAFEAKDLTLMPLAKPFPPEPELPDEGAGQRHNSPGGP